MQWSFVKIEPAAPRVGAEHAALPKYVLHLPLIADGRLAWPLLYQHPDLAMVERFFDRDELPRTTGKFLLIDNRWTCVWNATGIEVPANVRVIGSRFALGDSVGIRPVGSALLLYTVKESCSVANARKTQSGNN